MHFRIECLFCSNCLCFVPHTCFLDCMWYFMPITREWPDILYCLPISTVCNTVLWVVTRLAQIFYILLCLSLPGPCITLNLYNIFALWLVLHTAVLIPSLTKRKKLKFIHQVENTNFFPTLFNISNQKYGLHVSLFLMDRFLWPCWCATEIKHSKTDIH